MKNKVVFAVLPILFVSFSGSRASAQKPVAKVPAAKQSVVRSLTVATKPKAAVWLNDLRRGTTDETGVLKIEKIVSAPKKLRVRAVGFQEKTVVLAATQPPEITVELTETADDAEIAFQKAEFAQETGREAERRRAVELYRQALKANPKFVQAQIGLARVLNDLNEQDAALEAVAAARRINPKSAEASTVEGRIYRKLEDPDNAIKAFRRAIREAANFQPEAHTGLALALSDKGDIAASIAEFKIAVAQLANTEPVVYQYLGEAYDKFNRPQEAVNAYEQFLALAPTAGEASAVRSIIEQLKKRGKGETLELLPQ